MTVLEECGRKGVDPDIQCGGCITYRQTSGGFPSFICDTHRNDLEKRLYAIASRYPEVDHPEVCGCYGCSEGSW